MTANEQRITNLGGKWLPAHERGFTLIELVTVLVMIGILAVVALPRFVDLSQSAKVATLNGIAGSIRSVVGVVRSKAYTQGLKVAPSNPGSGQSAYIVETEAGSSELDWRNLCPESRAEMADKLSLIDYIDLSVSSGLTSQVNNRYTLIGYDIPGFSVPTNQGCYVIYDSFGDPECTITVVTVDC